MKIVTLSESQIPESFFLANLHLARVLGMHMPFPIELLELIFNFCYLGSTNEEPSLSTLFPYYLAEVDPLWKEILLKFPNYWTRVVSTIPNGVEDAKGISRPRSSTLFGVAIIRRCRANPDDATEKARVKIFLDRLECNMQLQCDGFFIYVYVSSSLPSITTDLNHIPPTFKYLRDDDKAASGQVPSYIIAIVLDGYTSRRTPPWLRHYKILMSLVVSPPYSNRSLGVLDIEGTIQTVFQMTTQPKEGSTNPPSLTVEDIDNPRFVMTLTRSMYLSLLLEQHFPQLQELHLTCGVFLREILQCKRLVLEGYDRAHFIISGLFDQTLFVSPEPHLIDCSGFTDSELDLLSKVDSVTKYPLFSFNLKSLKLTGCRNFTIAALNSMVNARGIDLLESPRAFLKLGSLEVSGYGTPLAVEDGKCLSTHLTHFLWEGELFSTAS